MKTTLAGWTLPLLAAAVLGCSKPHQAKVVRVAPEGSQGEASQTGKKTDDMSPEELASLLMGKESPPAEPAPEGTIALGPKLLMPIPKDWVTKQPRVGIIEHEYAIPAAKGDEDEGRVTVMAAGGSIDDNIERWYGQFTQPDGSETAKRAKAEVKEIAGHKVHLVDISGTYGESMGGGPFAPGKVVQRQDYRMLAAIVETSAGNYFIKFYGPGKTVAAQSDAFRKMVEGLKPR